MITPVPVPVVAPVATLVLGTIPVSTLDLMGVLMGILMSVLTPVLMGVPALAPEDTLVALGTLAGPHHRTIQAPAIVLAPDQDPTRQIDILVPDLQGPGIHYVSNPPPHQASNSPPHRVSDPHLQLHLPSPLGPFPRTNQKSQTHTV